MPTVFSNKHFVLKTFKYSLDVNQCKGNKRISKSNSVLVTFSLKNTVCTNQNTAPRSEMLFPHDCLSDVVYEMDHCITHFSIKERKKMPGQKENIPRVYHS